jgi:uncharacterized membrane protein
MDATVDDFFTKRHKRLIDLAKIARVVSWIVLVFYILSAGARIINGFDLQRTGFLSLRGIDPLTTIIILLDALIKFITGGVFWVGLQGIAHGLSMIVDTNLNYRGGAMGVKNG